MPEDNIRKARSRSVVDQPMEETVGGGPRTQGEIGGTDLKTQGEMLESWRIQVGDIPNGIYAATKELREQERPFSE